MDTESFNQYRNKIEYLSRRLGEYLSRRDNSIQPDAERLSDTYTRSASYLLNVTHYHNTPDVADFLLNLLNRIGADDGIIDAGCSSGFTGLALAQYGRERVTFHDYAGMGLDFLAWFIEAEPLPQARVAAYGQPIERQPWCVACDVLEHTGNHLAALKWFSTLGQKVALCYPLSVPFAPPYVKMIDEWVDDEMIQAAIAKRNTVLETYISDGRRYTIYEVIL